MLDDVDDIFKETAVQKLFCVCVGGWVGEQEGEEESSCFGCPQAKVECLASA